MYVNVEVITMTLMIKTMIMVKMMKIVISCAIKDFNNNQRTASKGILYEHKKEERMTKKFDWETQEMIGKDLQGKIIRVPAVSEKFIIFCLWVSFH